MKEHSMSTPLVTVPVKKVAAAIALALGLAAAPAAWSDNSTDTQVVNFSIPSLHEINVAAGPISIAIARPTPGADVTPATTTSSYDITTNASAATHSKKITASIDSDMPTNVTLAVTVAAPTSTGTSQGEQPLSSTDTDVVTGLQAAHQTNVSITYKLTAALDVPATSGSKTVTYTVVDL
jgi:hypothetical protein